MTNVLCFVFILHVVSYANLYVIKNLNFYLSCIMCRLYWFYLAFGGRVRKVNKGDSKTTNNDGQIICCIYQTVDRYRGRKENIKNVLERILPTY